MALGLSQWKISTKLGPLYLWASTDGLQGVYWKKQSIPLETSLDWQNPIHNLLRMAEQQIQEYLAGLRNKFDLKLDIRGTPFQNQVWTNLLAIPFGGVCSYGEVAASIGRPQAGRAVGTAIGKNPLCLVVPCHRVITASAELGGFSGGLDRKSTLLLLEGHKNFAINRQSK